jgi:hypothetical protein
VVVVEAFLFTRDSMVREGAQEILQGGPTCLLLTNMGAEREKKDLGETRYWFGGGER